MIQVKLFYFNDLRECTYVLWDETKEAIIVDPGCFTDREKARLADFIEKNELKPVKLVNTHGHFDHVMGNRFVCDRWHVKTYIHPDDVSQLQRAKKYCEMFGYEIEEPYYDTLPLDESQPVTFGHSSLQVIHTPGHTRGGVSLYSKEDRFILTGDTLFEGSIGRTDLPGGDYDAIMESLNKKIMLLDGDVDVLPGHGVPTSIAKERETNPFVRGE